MTRWNKNFIFALIIGSVFTGFLSGSTAFAASDRKCAEVTNLDESRALSEKFSTFYKSEFGASNYQAFSALSKLKIFNCGYFYIVETRVESPQVFGAEIAYFFNAKSFGLLGSVLIQ